MKAREGNYNEWRAAGTTIKKGVHYARSIDNFVNGHRGNEKLAVCAKLGILHTILVYEKHSALFRENRVPSAFRDEAQVRKSWLCDFLHILLNQIVVAENIKQIFNNLCIINFNYDRCIEQFLFHAIQEWSQKSEAEIAQLFENFKIYHPYGAIGLLPWQSSNSKPKVRFGESEYGDHLDDLVDQIKTYHEQIEQGDELFKMREELWKAERVIFLGFHFHQQNMDLLRLNDSPKSKLPRAYATVKDRSGADVEMIKRCIKISIRRDHAGDIIDTVNGDCKALFREYQSQW